MPTATEMPETDMAPTPCEFSQKFAKTSSEGQKFVEKV
jgi:hypothetical protein